MGRKSSWTGVLTSSDINTYLQDQAIQTYASTAARDSAITAPLTGQSALSTDTMTLWVYNGSAWVEYGTTGAWKSWTPTLTNMTLGNGTLDCQYFKIGRTVKWKFKFTLGTTSAVASAPYFSLPFTPADFTEIETSTGVGIDTSAVTRNPLTTYAVGGGCGLLAANAAGTYTTVTALSSVIPFTWASTDIIMASGTFEATT